MKNPLASSQEKYRDIARNILIMIGILLSLFTVTSVSIGQCTLVITDPQAVCSPATVDLTNPAITAGSTAGLTFSYWKDEAATISLANPSSAPSGTYYIKGTGSAGCLVIKPVVATVTERPFAEISYPGSPFCSTMSPVMVILTGTMGGTFSAMPAGLVIDPVTGSISPASSMVGTYTVSYTLPASGGCPQSVYTTQVTILAPPYAMIDYPGAPFCTAHAPVDVVLTGTTGGIFSASPAGLVIDAATGRISPQSSLPGTYIVTYTLSASGINPTLMVSIQLTISPLLTPTFNPIGPFCQNSVPTHLPSVSTNGISGIWNPAILNTATVGTFTYTFTPDAGQCAIPVSMAVTISTEDITPPVITCPSNATIECRDYNPPILAGSPTVTDNCDPSPTIIFMDLTISTGPCSLVITRTWSAVDFSGNTSTCVQVFTVVPSSGIENTDNHPDLQVYPNPNHGLFTFIYRSSLTGPIRMSVVDMTGRAVCDRNFADGSGIRETIRLPGGAKGIYLIRVISDAGVMHQKIIVE
jgi:hypothetical protein